MIFGSFVALPRRIQLRKFLHSPANMGHYKVTIFSCFRGLGSYIGFSVPRRRSAKQKTSL